MEIRHIILGLLTLTTIGKAESPDTSRGQRSLSRRAANTSSVPPGPWIESSSKPSAPQCMYDTTCLEDFKSTINACTSTRCTEDYPGECRLATGSWLDMGCFCNKLSSGQCDKCTSGSENKKKFFYKWLNATCGDMPTWNGLPQGWAQELKMNNMLRISYNDSYSGEIRKYSTSESCYDIYKTNLWVSNVYSASLVAQIDSDLVYTTQGESDDYPYSTDQDTGAFLDIDEFCTNVLKEWISYPCRPRGSIVPVILQARAICDNDQYPAFQADWNKTLPVVQSVHVNQSSFSTGPACLRDAPCSINSTQYIESCTSSRCKLSALSDRCDYISDMVDTSCFCKTCMYYIQYIADIADPIQLTLPQLAQQVVNCGGSEPNIFNGSI